jgi:hypothetical protein
MAVITKHLMSDNGAGVLFQERRDFYLSPNVTKELWTSTAPFTTLLSNRSVVTGLKDPLFKMFEHRSSWIKQQFQVNYGAGYTLDVNGVAVTMDEVVGLPANTSANDAYIGLQVEIWDSTLATKRGVALITAVGNNTVTMKAISAATIAISDDDVCIVIGNARGDGSLAPAAWADELEVVWNSTQFMRTAVNIEGALYYAALRGYSNELARLRAEKSKEHKMQKERAFLFGASVLGTGMDGGSFSDTYRTDANGKPVRTTYGLISALDKYGATSGDDQSVFSISAASYGFGNFVDDMEKVFQYLPESGAKYAFAGRGAISYFSKIVAGNTFVGKSGWNIQLGPETRDSLGFNIRRLETPHGVLNLVPTPGLRGPYNSYMATVSDENLQLVQFRPDMYKANIKTDDGYDGVKDEYTSDQGLGITLIESHKLFKIGA